MRGQVNSRKIGCLQRLRDRTTGENVWFKCSIVQETFDESRCTDVLPRVTPKPGFVLLHQSCPWSAEQGKFSLFPYTPEDWFRETDLAVPFRVSLLILHTPAESGAYSRDCSRCSRRRPYIFPHPLRYKVSSKYEISVLQLLYCIGTSYACTRIKKKTRE